MRPGLQIAVVNLPHGAFPIPDMGSAAG